MKILHAFPFFSVSRGGGTTDLIYKIAKAQQRAGHEVSVYTGTVGFDTEYADSLTGVNVVPIRSYLNFGYYVMPGMIGRVKRDIREFDVVHMHVVRTFQNVVLRHYCRKNSIPYVMDSHGSIPLAVNKRKIKRLFDIIWGRNILSDAEFCIAETDLGVEEYAEQGIPSAKIVTIPPPFDTEDYENLPEPGIFRAKYNIRENEKLITYLGRIHEIKGLNVTAEGFAELVSRREDVRLVIVGPDDGYEDELRRLISELGIEEKVLFTGFTFGMDKVHALVDADIVVQTSRYEQGAWAPIEGVLAGTPIVVSDNSGAGEDVVKMDAGYLTKFGNASDLADKFEFILNNPEEALAKTMKARQLIFDTRSMDNQISQYFDVYKSAMASGSR
jgi:glycosyltransferase involved in cell wall biosynthesis